jgi:hypothetical protein
VLQLGAGCITWRVTGFRQRQLIEDEGAKTNVANWQFVSAQVWATTAYKIIA